jgi:hypothetical protein
MMALFGYFRHDALVSAATVSGVIIARYVVGLAQATNSPSASISRASSSNRLILRGSIEGFTPESLPACIGFTSRKQLILVRRAISFSL